MMKKILILSIFLASARLNCLDNNEEGKRISKEFVAELAQNEVNYREKMAKAKRLVDNAVRHFNKMPIKVACNDFINNPAWRKGELYVYVYDENGWCYANGDDFDSIWKNNITELKYVGQIPLIKKIFSFKKGGTLGHLWNNSYRISYIRNVEKAGKKFALGAGFYPQDDATTCTELVKKAGNFLIERGKDELISEVNNVFGPFVDGDIYVFMYDMQGNSLANSDNLYLVGQNLINLTDSRGFPLIKKFIEVAKTKERGWVYYTWLNAPKRSYIEKFVDPRTGQEYILGAGYYPNINLGKLKGFVKRAVATMKTIGAKDALPLFSQNAGDYVYGGLYIFVLTPDGKCVANGKFPNYVGQNLINLRAQNGRLFIKEIIDIANRDGSGLLIYARKNANATAYFEKIDIPDGKFIVCSEFYPSSKVQQVEQIIGKTQELFKEKDQVEDAFRALSSRTGVFFIGDIYITVYDTQGVRYVNGIDKSTVWKNFINSRDQDGKTIVRDIIDTATSGGGWVDYRIRNERRRVYAQTVEKMLPNKTTATFVLVSGYFL